MRNPL